MLQSPTTLTEKMSQTYLVSLTHEIIFLSKNVTLNIELKQEQKKQLEKVNMTVEDGLTNFVIRPWKSSKEI